MQLGSRPLRLRDELTPHLGEVPRARQRARRVGGRGARVLGAEVIDRTRRRAIVVVAGRPGHD